MKKFALIVAGGAGSRMGTDIPKQFLNLGKLPVLMHTIGVFYRFDPTIEIIIVLPKIHTNLWSKLCSDFQFTIKHQIVHGGETRFESVKNGLNMIPNEGIVFIHDGVRPFVNEKTLDVCLKTAIEKGNAIPVISVPESVRKVEMDKNYPIDRNSLFLVQTPQVFQCKIIKEAYKLKYNPDFTDDASVAEAIGNDIHLVPGNRLNIKITYPEDLYKPGF